MAAQFHSDDVNAVVLSGWIRAVKWCEEENKTIFVLNNNRCRYWGEMVGQDSIGVGDRVVVAGSLLSIKNARYPKGMIKVRAERVMVTVRASEIRCNGSGKDINTVALSGRINSVYWYGDSNKTVFILEHNQGCKFFVELTGRVFVGVDDRVVVVGSLISFRNDCYPNGTARVLAGKVDLVTGVNLGF